MTYIKKNPVRDYLSVETSIFHAWHAVGMPPYILGCIPMECG